MIMCKYFHCFENKWGKERSTHMHTQAHVYVYIHTCPHIYKVNHKVIRSVLNSAAFFRLQYLGTILEKNWLPIQWTWLHWKSASLFQKWNSKQLVSLLNLFWFYFQITAPGIVIWYDMTHCWWDTSKYYQTQGSQLSRTGTQCKHPVPFPVSLTTYYVFIYLL